MHLQSNTLTAMVQLFLTLLAIFNLIDKAHGATCGDYRSANLPCSEIPNCSLRTTSLVITQLSNGQGKATSSSTARLCYTQDSLHIFVSSTGQRYLGDKNQFDQCNDSVFNMDVVELFISPQSEAAPKCYSEIDTSPFGSIFESGIYNPNLNHTGVTNYLIDCTASQVTTQTTISSDLSWQWKVSIPWKLINSPQGCPVSASASTPGVYRGNMYRVNELVDVATSCSSSTCEYMAWSPTLSNPPAFHEPLKFGYFILV